MFIAQFWAQFLGAALSAVVGLTEWAGGVRTRVPVSRLGDVPDLVRLGSQAFEAVASVLPKRVRQARARRVGDGGLGRVVSRRRVRGDRSKRLGDMALTLAARRAILSRGAEFGLECVCDLADLARYPAGVD